MSCTCHKRTFTKEANAKKALRAMRRSLIDWSRLNVYRCPSGAGFHIGNKQLPRSFTTIHRGETE